MSSAYQRCANVSNAFAMALCSSTNEGFRWMDDVGRSMSLDERATLFGRDTRAAETAKAVVPAEGTLQSRRGFKGTFKRVR